jgi:hypothetical protein
MSDAEKLTAIQVLLNEYASDPGQLMAAIQTVLDEAGP